MSYSEILGAHPVSNVAKSSAAVVQSPGGFDVKHLATTVGGAGVGAFAGYKMWKSHKYLGAITGAAVGYSAYPLAVGPSRQQAMTEVLAAGTAVVGSKIMKKHPVVGWLLGGVVGALVGRYALPAGL